MLLATGFEVADGVMPAGVLPAGEVAEGVGVFFLRHFPKIASSALRVLILRLRLGAELRLES